MPEKTTSAFARAGSNVPDRCVDYTWETHSPAKEIRRKFRALDGFLTREGIGSNNDACVEMWTDFAVASGGSRTCSTCLVIDERTKSFVFA